MNNKIKKTVDKIKDEDVRKLYIDANLTKEETAKSLNISLHLLSALLKYYNIKKDTSSIVSKRRETCISKYGVDSVSKVDSIKEKISIKNKLVKDRANKKRKETKKLRYGDENYSNIEKARLTKAVRYNNENYNNRDKYKETMLSRYEVDNGFKLEKTKNNYLDNLMAKNNYNPLYKELIDDREKSIEWLKDKNYSYFDISKELNIPHYSVSMWVNKLNLQDYINYTFTGKSHYEDEIVAFLESLNINNILRNARDIIKGQELDIYLPDYKIAIEFNGTYWHSDLFKARDYHLEKALRAEECGIRLIHIYQYEWDDINTREKIKSLLKISLHKVDKKIYARNCEIREITNKEAAKLNNAVHLQRHRNAKVTYGLFYNDELVQLMSFSHNRKYEWEIIRGCPGSNNIVVGGVSKLFTHFLREYNPKEVFSYCDFNKFDGTSYETLGMQYLGNTGPDLKYVIAGEVVNRKPSRYKEIKQFIEYRIYGAGSKKYLWKRDT